MLIGVNWGTYIVGVNTERVVETALGYFITPLVLVVLGVAVQRERLNVSQWLAVGMGALAVAVLTVDYGHLPYIALLLAASFGSYGLVKKRLPLRPAEGLFLESAVLIAPAFAFLTWLNTRGLRLGKLIQNAGLVDLSAFKDPLEALDTARIQQFDIVYAINSGRNGLELLSVLVTQNIVGEASRIGYGSALAVILLATSVGFVIAYLTQILDAIDVPVITCDTDGVVVHANRVAREALPDSGDRPMAAANSATVAACTTWSSAPRAMTPAPLTRRSRRARPAR